MNLTVTNLDTLYDVSAILPGGPRLLNNTLSIGWPERPLTLAFSNFYLNHYRVSG